MAVFLLVYVPDVGHGFIKDDYAWIRSSRLADPAGLVALFSQHVGFYRPLVSVSFAADYAVWGLRPWGYAATNLVLLLLDAALLIGLARRFGLPMAAALLGAAVWVFNFHGVNMALLWISGRTSLLVTLFALGAALAWLAGRRLLAGVVVFLALLCKEEAVLLPALFAGFALWESRSAANLSPSLWRTVRATAPLWIALGVYLLLRAHSGAFGPVDAPSFYRFSFSPLLLLRNLFEYLDRAATVALAVSLVLLAACRWTRVPALPGERRALVFAACWLPATYALTLFLPVRSSLYALLPSAASALAVAVVAARSQRASPAAFRRTAIGLLAIVTLLWPVYRARNERWVELADLSAGVMEVVRTRAAAVPPGLVVLVDDPGARANFDAALGSLLPDALVLELGPGWSGAIVAAGEPLPEPRALTLALRSGQIVMVP